MVCCPSLISTTQISVFDTHIAQYHLFTDDTQAYDHCPVSATPSLVIRLSSCVTDLAHSFASLRLQLNPSKTEFIWFDTRHSLAKLPSECRSLTICSSVIQCADVVRDLGVLLDSELSMQRHISKVVSASFYHLRRLRQIQNCVSRVVMSLVILMSRPL